MKHKSSYYTILLLAAIIGCVLRFWNLTAGIDAQGLPYSGPHFRLSHGGLVGSLRFALCRDLKAPFWAVQ